MPSCNCFDKSTLTTYFRILSSVILSERHEDLSAMFFCALDADRSGFLTEMDIALLSTESQSIKNRDSRDQVNLGGGNVRNNVFHDKKNDGLKEFIRFVAFLS